MVNEYLNSARVARIGLSGEIYGREKFVNKCICAKATYSFEGVKLSSKKMPHFYRTVSKISEQVNITKATDVLNNTDVSISALQECLYNDTSVMNLLLRQTMRNVASENGIDRQFRNLRISANSAGAAVSEQHKQLMQFFDAFSLCDEDKATAVWLLSLYINLGKDANNFIKALHKYDVKSTNACHAYLKCIPHKERVKMCSRISRLMCHWFAQRNNANEFVFVVHDTLADNMRDGCNNVKFTKASHPMLGFILAHTKPDKVVAVHNVVVEGTRQHMFALSKRDRTYNFEFNRIDYLIPALVDEWIKVIALMVQNPYTKDNIGERLHEDTKQNAMQNAQQLNEKDGNIKDNTTIHDGSVNDTLVKEHDDKKNDQYTHEEL